MQENAPAALGFNDFYDLKAGAVYRIAAWAQTLGRLAEPAFGWRDTQNASGTGDGPRTPTSAGGGQFATSFIATGTDAVRIQHAYSGAAAAAVSAAMASSGRYSLAESGGPGGALLDVGRQVPGAGYRISVRATSATGTLGTAGLGARWP